MRKEKPSRTAHKVAMNVVVLGANPKMAGILPPGTVEATERLLVASGAARARSVRWAGSRTMLAVYGAFDWMLPGQFEAFAHRKAFCERQVRDGIGTGATQILVLGADYDTMAWRLAPEFSGVNFFEIDHPATARLKAKGIDAMGQKGNLHLIPEDLGKRKLVDVLQASEVWDCTAQTVIIAEGLLMYLAPEAVRDLLCQCAAITGTGSRIAFTYVETGKGGRPDVGPLTGFILWTLKLTGEPWLWSTCPEELGKLLEETGWRNAPDLTGSAGKHGVEFFDVAMR
jgi:methyltransferase (TIGR00027 family)